MNNPAPSCCGLESRWINNGPALQYFFCDECKKEVSSAVPAEELQGLEQKPTPFFENKSVGKWVSLDAQVKHAAEYAKQIQADAFSKAFGFPPKWQGPPIAKRQEMVDSILKQQSFTKKQIDDIVRPLCKSGHKMSIALDCCLDCGVSYDELTK